MHHDRWAEAESEDRRRYEEHDHAEADPEILTNDAVRFPAQTVCERKVTLIICHQGDISCFQGHV